MEIIPIIVDQQRLLCNVLLNDSFTAFDDFGLSGVSRKLHATKRRYKNIKWKGLSQDSSILHYVTETWFKFNEIVTLYQSWSIANPACCHRCPSRRWLLLVLITKYSKDARSLNGFKIARKSLVAAWHSREHYTLCSEVFDRNKPVKNQNSQTIRSWVTNC